MIESAATVDGTQHGGGTTSERAFLVIYDGTGSRVLDIPDGCEITFGRSRACTVPIESEKASRVHARLRRSGASLVLEDAGSRNGTFVDGVQITGPHAVRVGAEIRVGPLTAVVGAAPRASSARIADSTVFDERLAIELDRARRYHRPAAVLMLRLAGEPIAVDAAITAVVAALRRMDTCADYGGDEIAVLLPESDRAAAMAIAQRLLTLRRDVDVRIGIAAFPADASTTEGLLATARDALRAARRQGPIAVAGPVPVVASADALAGTVNVSAAMRTVYQLVERIADASRTVLILGETGVGKELIAEALHRRSSRRERPLIKLNCAALPENLLESELFGHERGAFTGADRRKIGYFEAADGGTLFLDEIGEMPPALQAKLLRVLETRKLTRVGDTTEIPIDVRIVAATHRDLEQEVAAQRFRADLYFRISAMTIAIPPLRQRPDDIMPLAAHFAAQIAAELGQPPVRWSADIEAALRAYDWPGNVRELRNAVERAVVLASAGEVGWNDLPDKLRSGAHAARTHAVAAGGDASGPGDIRARLDELEHTAIQEALDAEGGNQTRTAVRLGISRRALIYKLEKYGLKAPPAR